MTGSDGRHHRSILKWEGAVFATRIVRGEGNVVAVLALLAAAQAAVVGKRMLDDHARHDEIEVGDDLSEVSLWRADGSLVGLGGGRTTLLLVYDPDCAHSDRVAVATEASTRHECTGGIIQRPYSPGQIAEMRSGLRLIRI